MPWRIERDPERCSEPKPFAVIKEDDGSVAGCHETEDAAKAQLAALYATEQGEERKGPRVVEHRSIPVEDSKWKFDPDTAEGTFSGYLSRFDAVDTYGTRMIHGCWQAGGLDPEQVYPLLDTHDRSSIQNILGGFRATEDDDGLFIQGVYANTQRGQEARTLAGMGFAPDLSCGFVRLRTRTNDPNALTATELVEGSMLIKGMASTPGAGLVSVREREDREDIIAEVREALSRIAIEDAMALSLRRRKAALRIRLLAS